ncbi:MAG: glycoside hydrolase family 31 protein [Mediterranea sp.]|jgi:alpha-D-xyloside xylohydrolase|nr:glycoside hydrolase family 31 protein [Mediterranea sp.]
MKHFLFLCSLLLAASTLYAQSPEATADVNGQRITLSFYTPTTVRILKAPVGRTYEKQSLSVTARPTLNAEEVTVHRSSGTLQLTGSKLRVALNLRTGIVTFSTAQGKRLLQEKAAADFKDFDDVGTPTFSVSQSFKLDKDETLYGLGQLQNGKMSQRNQRKYMIQGNTEDFTNIVHSVKGYGLFWDNYSPTTFADSIDATSFTSEVGDCVDYYFMYGGNADGVVSEIRALTGDVPLFPLWTYGFWQSKERYKSQEETVGIVKKYRELGVPLDGVVQDWQYWGGNYLWNAMEFLNADFPNPKGMMSDIHDMNAHLMISVWASFGPMTKPYREMQPKGMLLDFQTWPQSGSSRWPPRMDYPSGVRPYDPFNPEARDIFWRYLNEGLFSLGMDGWWLDSTEPDHLSFKPEDLNLRTYLGSFRRVRNAYPLLTVGGVYDHQRQVSSDKRVFILTRSAFAGQQRYGANTWTGDVQATWRTLARQIPAGLNFSLCGIPHWNSDIGGFFLGRYPRRTADPDYRELFLRWLQFGTFCPMMRSHGADAAREVWEFGEAGEPLYDAIVKFIRLRYTLLPYIYSTSWEVTARRSTFMRALVMDFAADKKVWDINDQYMFGRALLVCPVVEPSSESTVRTVYLPKGTDWYDFWGNRRLQGGQTLEQTTTLDRIPLFVRAGAILPVGPDVQYAEEKKWDKLTLCIYPGANGTFTLYEDEFDNYNYEKGEYSEIPFTWDEAHRTLTIGERNGSYKGMLGSRTFVVKLAGSDATQEISYNGTTAEIKL